MIIIIAVICFIVLLIILYSRWKKGNAEKKYQIDLKLRNDRLTERLNNAGVDPAAGKACHPYEADYHTIDQNLAASKEDFYQLTEKNGISEKKYLFSREEEAYIVNRGGEAVVLKTKNQRTAVCKIYCREGKLCVKALCDNPAVLQRRKQQTEIGKEGIVLKNRDMIRILNSEYIFQLF